MSVRPAPRLPLPKIVAPRATISAPRGIGVLHYALAASVLAHAVLLAVKFKLPDILRKPSISPPIEVTLVNTKSKDRPFKPDALAQANLDGGGNTDAARQLKSPLPLAAKPSERTQLEAAQRKVESLETKTREMMAQLKSQQSLDAAKIAKNTAADRAESNEQAARLIELQRLEAQIARDLSAYQQRPKKKHLGARVAEYRFARYVEDWRLRVERIGNENYPQDARQNKIYGSLVLTVGIKSDGSIESLEIDKGSGRRTLDTAALRIIKLAAPFNVFPAEIAKDTDILYITRTWSFTRDEGFGTKRE